MNDKNLTHFLIFLFILQLAEINIMRLRQLFFLLSLFFFSQKNFSQYYYNDHSFFFEFGGGIGGMNCITDIGGANTDKTYYLNEIRLKNTKLSGTFYASVMYQNIIGLRLSGTLGKIQSADSDIKLEGTSENIKSKNIRNLSFRSNISEVALISEFHPLMLFGSYINGPPKVSPYLLAGVGLFHFNPQTEYNGKTIDLRPLHTEGEGFAEYSNVVEYPLTQINLPIGLGVQYDVSNRFNLRLEYVHRVTFTDYLDDVSSKKFIDPYLFSKYLSPVNAAYANALYNRSTDGKIPARRGNPSNNDTYMTLSLKVGIVLGRVIDR